MTGLASWMRAGVKVVCIDDDFSLEGVALPVPTRLPMLNEVLTIAKVFTEDEVDLVVGSFSLVSEAGVYFTFLEIPEDQSANGVRCTCITWHSDNFRPLITTEVSEEADVALFASALRTATPEVDA